MCNQSIVEKLTYISEQIESLSVQDYEEWDSKIQEIVNNIELDSIAPVIITLLRNSYNKSLRQTSPENIGHASR